MITALFVIALVIGASIESSHDLGGSGAILLVIVLSFVCGAWPIGIFFIGVCLLWALYHSLKWLEGCIKDIWVYIKGK